MAKKNRYTVSSVADVVGSGMSSDRKRVESLSVDIIVDEHAERSLVTAVRDAFMPEQGTAHVNVSLLSSAATAPDSKPDLAIIVAGGADDSVRVAWSTYAYMGVPVAVVATSALDAPVPSVDETASRYVSAIVASDPASVVDRLAHWVVSATPKATAVAASFPFCRKARADELIAACSGQNALIGVLSAMGRGSGGADFVVMTANQAKLALDLSATYGRELSPQRALELAGVAVAGLGYRQVARSISRHLPIVNSLFNAGVAYGGTMLMGQGLVSHFEREDAGEAPLPRVRAVAEKAADLLPDLLSRPARPSADYKIIPVSKADLQADAR